jgi:DNA-directed RNA polymerase subunit beta'
MDQNVIMGKLIPAGTGMPRYRNIRVEPTEDARSTMYSMGVEGAAVFVVEHESS